MQSFLTSELLEDYNKLFAASRKDFETAQRLNYYNHQELHEVLQNEIVRDNYVMHDVYNMMRYLSPDSDEPLFY